MVSDPNAVSSTGFLITNTNGRVAETDILEGSTHSYHIDHPALAYRHGEKEALALGTDLAGNTYPGSDKPADEGYTLDAGTAAESASYCGVCFLHTG
jgi:hypothetical protein